MQAHHYDGTIFHRVISDFMIQGGGLTADRQEKETGKPIRLESKNGLKKVRGSVAMARTDEPHSATDQFFINVKDNDFLNADKTKESGTAQDTSLMFQSRKGVVTGIRAGRVGFVYDPDYCAQ